MTMRLLISLLLVTASFGSPPPGLQKLYFAEEYDGTSLNTSRWNAYHNTYGDGNKEVQCYQPQNIVVSAGVMTITAKRQSVTCPGGSVRSFTAGFIGSREVGRYYPRHAYYEIRAKTAHAQGVWPAFWLRHRNGAATCEVDVLEYFHSAVPGKSTQTLHLDFVHNVAKRSVFFESPTTTPQWHTWGVAIEPAGGSAWRFTFNTDNVISFQFTDTKAVWATQGDPNAMFDIAQNVALGGTWVGDMDGVLGELPKLSQCAQSGTFPCGCRKDGILRWNGQSQFVVDYVRVYVPGTATATTTLATTTQVPATTTIAPSTTAAPSVKTLSIPLRSASDDVEQFTTSTTEYCGSTDLELGADGVRAQWVGLRYILPLTAADKDKILSASLQFTAATSDTTDLSTAIVSIRVESTANAAPFCSGRTLLRSRVRGATIVSWSMGSWSYGTNHSTPDLRSLIRSIIGRADWKSNNAIAFIITSTFTKARHAYSYEGSSSRAPRLVIRLAVPTTTTAAPTTAAAIQIGRADVAEPPQDAGTPVWVIGVSVAGAALLMAAFIIVVVILRRRHASSSSTSATQQLLNVAGDDK